MKFIHLKSSNLIGQFELTLVQYITLLTVISISNNIFTAELCTSVVTHDQLVKLNGCDTLSVSSYRLPHSQTTLVVADLVEMLLLFFNVAVKNLEH